MPLDDIPQLDEVDDVLDALTSPTSLEVYEAILPYENDMVTAAIGKKALVGGVGGPPSGAAGGVLGGTYPNPSFADDMATQAELDAHTTDATDAHDATAISFAPAGTIAATTVQAAIEEVASEAGGGSPAASAVTVDSTTLVGTGTDAQAVFEELDNGIADHLADTSAAHAASAISADSTTLVGTGTDVQAVFEELDNAIAANTSAMVTKALYDANTVLAADSDDTPAALAMGASTILARLASGNIKAATPAELRTLLDVPTTGEAVLDAIVDAKGDMILGTAADTVARLAAGANGTVPTYQSGQTTGVLPQFPPAYEFGYAEITAASTTTTGTVRASAATAITAPSITFDGSTTVSIEVGAIIANSGALATIVTLWEDSTDLTAILYCQGGSAVTQAQSNKLRRTPTSGAKVYTVRFYVSAASTGSIFAGSGAGTNPPAYIRIVKV